MLFKQSTAGTISVGPFVAGTDGLTPATAVTLGTADIKIHRNGEGTLLGASAAASHISGGIYSWAVGTAEVGVVGPVEFHFRDNGTAALPIVVRGFVCGTNTYDTLSGSDLFDVSLTQWKGTSAADYTGDSFARLGAPVGASISADIANVDSDLATAVGTTATLDQVVAEINAIPEGTTWYGTLVDLIWDEVLTGATHNVATSAGRRLRQIEGPVSGTISGTSTAGTIVTNITPVDTGFYKDQLLVFTDGTLAGQVRPVLTISTGGTITFDEALTRAPAIGDAFDILPAHIHTLQDLSDAVWDEALSEHTGTAAFGGKVQGIGTDVTAILADTANMDGTTIPNIQGTVSDVGAMIGTLQGTAATIDQILSDLANNKVGTAVWSQIVESQGSYTAAQVMSIVLAVLAGVTGTQGSVFFTPNGTSVRLTATCNTSNERTSMTLTPGTMA